MYGFILAKSLKYLANRDFAVSLMIQLARIALLAVSLPERLVAFGGSLGPRVRREGLGLCAAGTAPNATS